MRVDVKDVSRVSVGANSGREEEMVWDDVNLEDESESVVNASVFLTVLYSLKHLPILTQVFSIFDKTINHFYRHMFKHTQGFPNAMIHAPRAVGGLQQTSLAKNSRDSQMEYVRSQPTVGRPHNPPSHASAT